MLPTPILVQPGKRRKCLSLVTGTRDHWNDLQKNPAFVISLVSEADRDSGKLTAEDVGFLIRCGIDAFYDYHETLEAVKSSSPTAVETLFTSSSASTIRCFPSADDDFSSFEFPQFRGLLAETTLSKKLASYALGKEEICTGDFSAVAPQL